MDSYPAIRRRARTPRPENADAPSHQSYAEASLIIVTDDPDFREPRLAAGTRVWRWVDPAGAAEEPAHLPSVNARTLFHGDPTDARTYQWVSELSDVSAIVALLDPQQNRAAMAALRKGNPRTGLLVVGSAQLPEGAGVLARPVNWHDALRTTIERDLNLLETLKRVQALRAFAADAPVVPIRVHEDPDPDALASALAVRTLLRRTARSAPIVTLDAMTRPENRRMAELLDLQVTQISAAELAGFERVICTDMQPHASREVVSPGQRLAVIDHHPFEGVAGEYFDIRPNYGATATILTEYLIADDERRVNKWLATGLVYAIKTDTDNLTRGVSSADVEAWTFLLERADRPLLSRIERPSLSAETALAYGQALAGLLLHGDLAVAYAGRLSVEQSHILADLADFCLAIDEATWAAAAALVEDRLVITLRHLGAEPGAGDLARALRAQGGTGGGHATMARAVLPLTHEWGILADAPLDKGTRFLLERISARLARIRSD